MANEVRRLSAIVAFDMVGYSRLMEADELGTLAAQRTIQQEILDPKVSEYGGRIVKTTGDGALLEFASAVNAVSWAASVQRAMQDRKPELDAGHGIFYRIGVNLGDILVEGTDIFGEGVNIAARLEGLAEPGGILVSEAVFRNVRGRLDLGFADLGYKKVKNLSEPVRTFEVLLDEGDAGKIVSNLTADKSRLRIGALALAALVLIGVGSFLFLNSNVHMDTPQDGILIVPFTAGDGDEGVYAKAATELFLRSFGRLKHLPTATYKTSMAHQGIDVSMEDLQRDVGARYVLDGSTSRSGGKVEISVRLRDTQLRGDAVLWQQTIEVDENNFFKDLVKLKLKAAGELKVKLNPVEREIFEATPATSPGAYLAYANAERLLHSKEFTDISKALPLYEEAIALDAGFADAKLGYAEANFQIWQGSYNTIRFTLDALEVASNIIREVLNDDPANPVALNLQVRLLLQKLDRERALTTARGSVFNNPSAPGLRYVLGLSLTAVGNYEEALEAFEEYEALSPRLSSGEKGDLAWSYLRAGEGKKALTLLQSIPDEELREQHFRILADAHYEQGNGEQAREYIERFLRNNVWLNLMWMKPWFDTYKDPDVYNRFAQSMLASGLPEWPFDAQKGREEDRIRHDELVLLYSDNYEERHTTGPFGAPYSEERSPDGTLAMNFGWMNGIPLAGTWRIKDDQVCQRIPSVHQGREQCHYLYLDSDKSTATERMVSSVLSFGVIDSVFVLSE